MKSRFLSLLALENTTPRKHHSPPLPWPGAFSGTRICIALQSYRPEVAS